jgi:hypothetical protein
MHSFSIRSLFIVRIATSIASNLLDAPLQL